MRILLLFLVLLLLPIALEGSECGPISDIDGCSANATYCEPLRFYGSKWNRIVDCPDKLWLGDVPGGGGRSPYTKWTEVARLWCHKDARWHVLAHPEDQSSSLLKPGWQVICSKMSPDFEGSITIMDACPVSRADQLGCTRLGMDKYGRILCNLKQWWSSPQLIYHAPTRTTTVTTVWHEKKIDLVINVDDDSKLMCSTRKPELSVEAFMWQYNGSKLITNGTYPGNYICPNDEGNGCGNGDCVMVPRKRSSTKVCQCHFGWRGPSCDEAYDPFGVGSSDVARVPFRPANAMEDSCNILLIEGCPDEATDDCIKLRFAKFKDRDGEYCPRLLWLSTEKGWKYITKLGCANKQWYYKVWHHETYKGEGLLKPNSRVRCAHSRPPKAPLALRPSPSFRDVSNSSLWMGANLTHLCFRNEIHCKNGGICVHHHGPANTKTLATYCECPPGFPGEQCESALEVVPRRPNCSLILVEGCPGGNKWKEGWKTGEPWEGYLKPGKTCEPLQYDEASQSVSCTKILWRSNVQAIFNEYTNTNSYTTKWTRIEKLQCVDDKWHMLYKNGSKGGLVGATVLLNTKVICAKWTPTVETDAFIEHSYYPTQAGFANGSVKSSPIAFCPEGHPDVCNAKPHNRADMYLKIRHGHCVLSYKEGHFTPSCKCDFGWAGINCSEPIDPYGLWCPKGNGFSGDPRIPKPDGTCSVGTVRGEPAPGATRDTCHIPDAEGCPDEDEDGCHKLRYFDKGVHCPRKLWVSTGDDQGWAPIDRLECTAKGWMIHRSLNGNRTKEPLSLTRRVQCAAGKPTSVVAFSTSDPYFDEDDGKIVVDDMKETYCFHNFGRCQNTGHCILNYEGSTLNHERCLCRAHPMTKERYVGSQCETSRTRDQQYREWLENLSCAERRKMYPDYWC